MSKLARTITVGAILAAMSLTSTAAIAQVQSSDSPASTQDTRRPPTEAQVGESWRHRQVAANNSAIDDTRRPPTEGQVGEPWHPRMTVPVRPAAPTGQPVSPVAWLGGMAALLALAGALAVLAVKRAGSKARPGQAA
jgi:hypothetical protein